MEQDNRIIDDFDRLVEALRVHKGELILYGAGLYGEETMRILKRAGCRVAAFCDGNPAKAGTVYLGVPVISIAQLRERPDAMVITSLARPSLPGACQGLLEAGISKVYAVVFPEFSFLQLKTSPESLPRELDAAGEARVLYPLLADEGSRALFAAILYASLSGDCSAYTAFPQTDCPVKTELTIDVDKLPLFQRQARAGQEICLRWNVSETGWAWLAALVELYDMAYTRFWICLQADVLQIGGIKA